MKTLSHTSFSKGGDNTMKQKHIPARCFFYLFGMLVLAMGLILNIKAGLGLLSNYVRSLHDQRGRRSEFG